MTTLDLPLARPVGKALLVAMRPKQWVKNLLVFAAPMAGGALTHPHVATSALVTFVAFVLASGACYLVNDVYDVDRDRMHPLKRHRPIAAGDLTIGTAVTAAIALLTVAVMVMLPLDHDLATLVLLGYVLTVVLYGARLKNVAGVELGVLSLGFVLRPLAGAAATDVPPSPWFLLVCCFAALTIALGKRQVELGRLAASAAEHRACLAGYTRRALRRARVIAAAAMVSSYALWGLSRATTHDRVFALLTLVPVVGALLRLGRLNDAGVGDAPETVLLTDRWTQFFFVSWLVVFAVGLGRV